MAIDVNIHTKIQENLEQALEDIIEGRIVKRSQHQLLFDGQPVTELFLSLLERHRYDPRLVKDIIIEPGERIPAFFIRDHTAYFGWVFWEKFSELRLRKLFGTVVKNNKGDWLIQLPANSKEKVYANISHVFEMDIDRPFEL